LLCAANSLLFWANGLFAAVQSRLELEMVRRVKVPTKDVFLTADGVATRLARRELKKAKIDPGPLLAKAGISLLELGEEPKRVKAESQIRLQQRRSVTRRWAFTSLSTSIFASAECSTMSWPPLQI
jgi:hypothetical protein